MAASEADAGPGAIAHQVRRDGRGRRCCGRALPKSGPLPPLRPCALATHGTAGPASAIPAGSSNRPAAAAGLTATVAGSPGALSRLRPRPHTAYQPLRPADEPRHHAAAPQQPATGTRPPAPIGASCPPKASALVPRDNGYTACFKSHMPISPVGIPIRRSARLYHGMTHTSSANIVVINPSMDYATW